MPLCAPLSVAAAPSAGPAELEAGWADAFVLRPLSPAVGAKGLPERQIGHLSFSAGGLNDALALLLEGTGFALAMPTRLRDGEHQPAAAFNLSGSLPEVLTQVAEQAGLFHQVRDHTVVFRAEAEFALELPPALADDSLASITESLRRLGAWDVHRDRLNRTLVFRTNHPELAGIRDYVGSLRDRRALLVYDVQVYEVDLSGKRSPGIAWPQFAGLRGDTGELSAVPGSSAVRAVLPGEPQMVDALARFLQTQGTVTAVSTPRIALVSGGSGQIRVGQSTTFVSKVGGPAPGGSAHPVTVETQTVDTGLELTLQGDVQDDAVYTRVGLNVLDIVKVDQTTVLGTQLKLPQTAKREVTTTVRARPGEVILLGGLWMTKDSREPSPGWAAWLRPGEPQRIEWVVALTPRVVRFSKEGATLAGGPAAPIAQVVPTATATPAAVTVSVEREPSPTAAAPRLGASPSIPTLGTLLGDLASRVSAKSAEWLKRAAAVQVQP